MLLLGVVFKTRHTSLQHSYGQLLVASRVVGPMRGRVLQKAVQGCRSSEPDSPHLIG